MKQVKVLLIASITSMLFSCGSSNTQSSQASSSSLENISLSAVDFGSNYVISSQEYGTMTTVVVKDNKRIMKTNALPNHKTGSFPNKGNPNTISAQERTYEIPLNPVFSGESKWAREPGVALNGVKFEPETAERFVCETGEVYRIEAFQDLLDMGLDHNHAHVQPTGAYHYHGVPTELVKELDKGEDIILVGYALDGFPMYYSKSGHYKPSYQLSSERRTGDDCLYDRPNQRMEKAFTETIPDGTFVSDWVYTEGLGQLDECNGAEVNGTYGYFVTDDYPYIGRCLKGVFKEERRKGPPPGQHSHGKKRPHNH